MAMHSDVRLTSSLLCRHVLPYSVTDAISDHTSVSPPEVDAPNKTIRKAKDPVSSTLEPISNTVNPAVDLDPTIFGSSGSELSSPEEGVRPSISISTQSQPAEDVAQSVTGHRVSPTRMSNVSSKKRKAPPKSEDDDEFEAVPRSGMQTKLVSKRMRAEGKEAVQSKAKPGSVQPTTRVYTRNVKTPRAKGTRSPADLSDDKDDTYSLPRLTEEQQAASRFRKPSSSVKGDKPKSQAKGKAASTKKPRSQNNDASKADKISKVAPKRREVGPSGTKQPDSQLDQVAQPLSKPKPQPKPKLRAASPNHSEGQRLARVRPSKKEVDSMKSDKPTSPSAKLTMDPKFKKRRMIEVSKGRFG